MALPTMPHYWTTRKNLYEQNIVRRRNQDTDFREKWSNTANYFLKNDVEMTKQRAWESEDSMQDSIHAYRKGKKEEEKKKNLQRRRMKLAQMLKEERDQYEAELKGYSRDNYSRLGEMKERAETLRSAREEKRKNIAQEKLYEHWRQNNPDIRKIESEQLKDYVVGNWPAQKQEKEERLESARKEKEEYEQQMEEERLAGIARDRQKMEEKIEEERKLKEKLKEQMLEIRARDTEAEMLKKEEEELEKQQWELENLEEERKQMEERRKKQDFGRVLLRQHIAQMRRHSKQVQEELELDRKILEALAEKEAELQEVQTARKEKAKADASWMKKVIEDQIRVEKAREAELDLLYQDEAARMWQKREAEWEKERRARERLMKEVLESRTEQIEERMEAVRFRHEESIKQREQLLRELEIANQLTRRDQEKIEADREQLKHDLKQQLTARKVEEEDMKLRLQLEEDEEEKADKEYEEFLRQETERLKLRGFTPRHHGKQAWM
ncbi:trichoplein keratin filament-binding protein-like [Mercenaria mercenaria]|uniref:trichoplein keratin filament-binding protein-like n=1 Tax=Mercenaria mercenaria TaxID=6596 RepID=UPI00234E763B|nr:trichoplein keratin filament-binding protein-like [Mercenaria mercenaria]